MQDEQIGIACHQRNGLAIQGECQKLCILCIATNAMRSLLTWGRNNPVADTVGHEVAKFQPFLHGQIAVEFGPLHDLKQFLQSTLAHTQLKALDNGQKHLARH
jgi:hypothetical protein